MRVFVTGATGFIGSVVVRKLIESGHQVLGLARSDVAEASLRAAGAVVHRGDLTDLASLRRGTEQADGVIHTGFVHDFTRFAETCEIDRHAITALGDALAGSARRLVITSGTGVASHGPEPLATEDVAPVPSTVFPRGASEEAGAVVLARGIDVSVVRLPPSVHAREQQGLVTGMIARARESGISAYVGDGLNRWPAVHRDDAASLFQLALESGVAGMRYNAVAEEGVALRAIAESIGRHLKLPVVSQTPDQAAVHFGWQGVLIARNCPASSAWTRQQLGWRPAGPGLLADLDLVLA